MVQPFHFPLNRHRGFPFDPADFLPNLPQFLLHLVQCADLLGLPDLHQGGEIVSNAWALLEY